ncbi:MAG: hypothetical protein AAB036_05285 [Elusimicrobiota bacterium]
MAKNKNTMKKDQPAPPSTAEPLSLRGKKIAAAGGVLVLCGFISLSLADSRGENLPARLAAFLLIAGYATIGIGLFLPSPSPVAPDPQREKKTI